MRVLPARARSYYYGWNIVAICVLAQLSTIGIAFNCFSLFLPAWSHEMGAPTSELLLSVMIFMFAGALCGPLTGLLSDKFPSNVLIGVGLLLSGAAYIAVAFVHSAVLLIVCYVVLITPGIMLSTSIPTQAVVARWFSRNRGLAMGLNALGVVIAGVVFPPLVVWLFPQIGWRGVWLGCGLLTVCIVAPLAAWALYDRPSPDDEGVSYVDPSRSEIAHANVSIWEILIRRNTWIMAAVLIATMSTYFAITLNVAPIIISHHFSLATASLVISLLSAADFTSKLLFGVLVDWFGNRVPLMLVALFSAIAALGLTFVNSQEMLYLAVIPLGLSGGFWTVFPATVAAEFGPAKFGLAFGLISMATPIANMAAPALARLKEQSGTYNNGLLALAALALAGSLLAGFLRQGKHEAEAAVASVPSAS